MSGTLAAAFGGLPQGAAMLALLPEVCALVLAVVVLLLSRHVRRNRAAMRGLAAEVMALRQSQSDLLAKRDIAEGHVGRILGELAELQRRQRSLETRIGKPDPKLAAAMTRAGTNTQHMVDCGLSHGEVHLLQALNAAKSGTSPQAS